MALKIAFTGTGTIAKVHAHAAAKLPDVQLVAVVNHRAESRQAFADEFGLSRQYQTIADLLADGEVDAISINTPNYLHAPETISALEAGVHVLVEKPMAMNAVEGREMLRASEQSGVLLMVAHCWRYDPEVLWVKDEVARGRVGRIIRTKGYGVHVNWGPSGWFTQARFAGGGAMADVGIHAIDTVRFLLGDPQPVSVYARIGTHYQEFDVDDTGLLLINWDNGATSYVESGWWQPHADGPFASVQLYGTRGLATLFPTQLRRGNQVETPGYPHPREPHAPPSLYDAQMAHFVDCIREGRQPLSSGRDGLINLQIVDAAYESGRTGQVVTLSP